ncbi:MAG: metallophosphoesterase, partial [Planctomyces sp.]
NHDWRYDFEEVRRRLQASGWRSVAGSVELFQLKDRHIAIGGSERPWMGAEPVLVANSLCDLTILLSHSPDQLPAAQRLGYDLLLAGHTHGGQVVLPVVGPVFSPSRYGVALASGLFQGAPTTVHVSRGIGAKDPIRWNCTPELTVLEVQF